MTPAELIAFEDDIEREFAAGKIRAPVHFSGGNETQLIEIFKNIKKQDWVLSAWRSHYHALLRGVPPKEVKDAIMAGHSIAMCFSGFNFLSSALVGGICPIAVGLAWAIKARGGQEKVHCFLGDMTGYTGIFQESYQYSTGHDLPVNWIIEDNGKSVMTDTATAWGKSILWVGANVRHYKYKLTKPHVGIGKFVSF